MELNRNFHRGWEGVQTKQPSVGGYKHFLEQHNFISYQKEDLDSASVSLLITGAVKIQ